MSATAGHLKGVTMPTVIDDGPICPLTELPVAWCDHCRSHDLRQRRQAKRHTLGVELRAQFTARYDGTCALCGEVYTEGSYIGVTTDHLYICEECTL